MAWALRMYDESARRNGLSAPPEFAAFARVLGSVGVSEGQRGSIVGDPREATEDRSHEADLVTYREAAGLLRCSVSTVKRRVAAGELVPVRIGGVARLSRSDLTAYIERGGTQTC